MFEAGRSGLFKACDDKLNNLLLLVRRRIQVLDASFDQDVLDKGQQQVDSFRLSDGSNALQTSHKCRCIRSAVRRSRQELSDTVLKLLRLLDLWRILGQGCVNAGKTSSRQNDGIFLSKKSCEIVEIIFIS